MRISLQVNILFYWWKKQFIGRKCNQPIFCSQEQFTKWDKILFYLTVLRQMKMLRLKLVCKLHFDNKEKKFLPKKRPSITIQDVDLFRVIVSIESLPWNKYMSPPDIFPIRFNTSIDLIIKLTCWIIQYIYRQSPIFSLLTKNIF